MNLYQETMQIWKENQFQIEPRISGWVSDINNKLEVIDSSKKAFHEWKPLRIYISVTQAKKNGIQSFSVRFCGQEVGEIRVKNGGVNLNINKKTEENNRKYFELYDIKAGIYPWKGNVAKEFRNHFKNFLNDRMKKNIKVDTRSTEHQVESKLIEEMEKGSSDKFEGRFSGIQPVMLSGIPFQMPVPFSASTGKPKFSKTGGNIDILARTKGRGLSVWELKKPHEFKHAVFQVYIYSVILILMLRSNCGSEWYKLFGFTGKLPTKLKIDAVIAITRDQKSKLEEAVQKLLNDNNPRCIGNDLVNLSVAYYDPETFMIEGPPTIIN